ncbi:hypothetical protein D3C78_1395570 [compost metagenome]
MTGNHQCLAKRRFGAFGNRDRLIVLHIIIAGRLTHIAQPVTHIIGAGKGQDILLIIAVDPGLETRCRVMQAGGVNACAEQGTVVQAGETANALTGGVVNVLGQ